MNISLIVAAARNGVIGSNGTIPWKMKEDMAHFRAKTTGHIVIMGRLTYESIGKPLPNRLNIVISSKLRANASSSDLRWVTSLQEALDLASGQHQFSSAHPWPDEVFIIGGERVYRDALPLASKVYLTEIDRDVEGDTYFPKLDLGDWTIDEARASQEHGDVDYVTYRRMGR